MGFFTKAWRAITNRGADEKNFSNVLFSQSARQRATSGGSIQDLLKLQKGGFDVATLGGPTEKVNTEGRYGAGADLLGTGKKGMSNVHDIKGKYTEANQSFSKSLINKELQTLLPAMKKRIAQYQIGKAHPGVRKQTRN